MRTVAALIAVVCCVAAVIGIAYLHGFERGFGREEWRHRPALISAYETEVRFRAGPCVAFALASVAIAVFGRSRALAVATAGATVVVCAVSVVGTYLTIREYIRAWGGQRMPSSSWDGVTLAFWAAAVFLVGVVVFVLARWGRRPAVPGAAADLAS
ncbi:MAG: hypothetical protein ACRC8S_06895 [Fimbriiglobus sp.]